MISPSSLSSVAISTSLIRGAYNHRNQSKVLLLRERNPHRPHKYLVTLVEGKMWIGIESSTSILPSQSNDIMVENIERETFPRVSIEVRVDEVVSLLEKIPSMIKLDAPQPRKVVVLIFGAESIVENGCHKDDDCANGTGSEPVVLSCDEIQDCRVESGHEAVGKQGGREYGFLFTSISALSGTERENIKRCH